MIARAWYRVPQVRVRLLDANPGHRKVRAGPPNFSTYDLWPFTPIRSPPLRSELAASFIYGCRRIGRYKHCRIPQNRGREIAVLAGAQLQSVYPGAIYSLPRQ